MRDLVLLHGWAMSPRVWEPVIPGLSTLCRVHNRPLPGYERAESPVVPRYDAMAGGEILDRWSDECLAAAPAGAVWVGWSLGALVAMNAARRAPGAIEALALVSATPKFRRQGDWEAGMDVGLLRGFMDGIQTGDDRLMKRFVLLQAGESDDRRALGRSLSPCVAGHRIDAGVLAAGLKVLEEVDLRSALDGIQAPVRVIHGVEDRIVPIAAGAYVADHVPEGDLVRLETGHAPFMTRTGAFLEAVRTWM